jgi:hypothetical protein
MAGVDALMIINQKSTTAKEKKSQVYLSRLFYEASRKGQFSA